MSFNPLIWKGFDLNDKAHEQLFMGQLSDLLNSLSSGQGLSSILNAQASLQSSALTIVSVALGTVTTNQTVDCSGATSVAISADLNATPLNIAMTHLALGVPIMVHVNNLAGATRTLKLSATQPSGTAYLNVAWKTSTGAVVNMTSTGLAILAGGTMISVGAATPIPQVLMVAN